MTLTFQLPDDRNKHETQNCNLKLFCWCTAVKVKHRSPQSAVAIVPEGWGKGCLGPFFQLVYENQRSTESKVFYVNHR